MNGKTHRKPMSELQNLTCHMGLLHSATSQAAIWATWHSWHVIATWLRVKPTTLRLQNVRTVKAP